MMPVLATVPLSISLTPNQTRSRKASTSSETLLFLCVMVINQFGLWGRSIFNVLFVDLVLVIFQHASQSPH